jgi:hypothetical protein
VWWAVRQRSKTNESIRPEEVFFFEKKNQKTLRRCRGPMPSNGFKKQKFFASFFSKKKALLSSHGWIVCFSALP